MANFVLGYKGVLKYSTTPIAPAGSSPTNTEFNTSATGASVVTQAQDVTLDLSTDKADITTRANNGWTQEVPTLKKGHIKFKMLWKPSDAAFIAIRDAWLNGTELFIAALDGPTGTAGNSGPAGNFTVTNFTRNEGLKEGMTVDGELSPSSYNGWMTTT